MICYANCNGANLYYYIEILATYSLMFTHIPSLDLKHGVWHIKYNDKSVDIQIYSCQSFSPIQKKFSIYLW